MISFSYFLPPANAAYYLPVTVSVIVVAVRSSRISDSDPVISLLICPLVIQKAFIVSTGLSAFPPTNTAYYLPVTVSVIVVAWGSPNLVDNVPFIIGIVISPSSIQNASILP